MRIRIGSDSTCDLSPELFEKHNIARLPLTVTLGDFSGKDGVDVTPDKIYAYVAEKGVLPTTSALNVAEYSELFTEILKDADALVYVTIGSGFSSCYQNACIAAQDFDNVFVIDSQNLSTGQGHVVLEAVKGAEKCETMEDVAKLAEELRELTTRVEASFILDKLDYMHKGGRCSVVALMSASLMNIKPCIEVKDGKMGVAKKYRGNLQKCLKKYVEDRLKDRDDIIKERIFITDSGISDEIREMVSGVVKECADFEETYVTRAGCTVSSHCGENTLGVLFIRK